MEKYNKFLNKTEQEEGNENETVKIQNELRNPVVKEKNKQITIIKENGEKKNLLREQL